MLRLLKSNKIFYSLTLLFTLVGAVVLIVTEKGDVELWANRHNHPFLDFFFYYITYLGDGIITILAIFLLLIYRIYYGIMGAIIFSVSSLITQLMKRLIFDDYPRPSKFFDPSVGLRFIDGLEIHSWYSFPSGHSSGAFTIFLLISLISGNKAVQFICFFLALAAAFSRVYLLQHFFMDIYGGALLGVAITTILFYLIHYKTSLSANSKLNQPLSELLKKPI